MVLSKVVTWMRSLSGATELRAVVYMDEVFGYAPPTANPPAKKPILTMLKQARAYGVGLVLSTQNPVDLDYKAMSNTGTWMIGRLQTERDKARILEALESARGGSDMKAIDKVISGLEKRQFLRGPLTRKEVEALTSDAPERRAAAASPTAEQAAPVEELADDETPVAPGVAKGIAVSYLDPATPWAKLVEANPTGTRLEPMIAARINLVYDETKADLRHEQTWEAIFHPLGERFDPADAVVVDYDDRDFRSQAPADAGYALVDAPIDTASFWRSVKTDLKDHLYRNASIEVFRNVALKLYSRVGESEDVFQQRCDRAAEDQADIEIAKLRDRLDARLDRAKDQLAAAHRRMQELEIDADTRKRDEWVSGASEVLGVLLGRKRSRSLSGASRRRSQTRRTEQRLQTARAKVQDKVEKITDIEEDIVLEVEEINDKWEDAAAEIDTLEVGLEKNDISVDEVALVWVRK